MKRLLHGLVYAGLISIIIPGCGGGGGGGDATPIPPTTQFPIADISGEWSVDVSVTNNCPGEEPAFDFTASLSISQNGDDLSIDYVLPLESGTVQGTITGGSTSWEISYPEDGGTTTIPFTLTISADGNNASGSSSWSWSDGISSCGGSVMINANRNPDTGVPPDAPINLQADAVGNDAIHLIWDDQSDDETSFMVERSTVSGSGFDQIAVLPPKTGSFDDSGLNSGVTYYYRVRAGRNGNYSAYSNEANATTGTPAIDTPLAPSNLTATSSVYNRVELSWLDNSDNETSFEIEKKVGTGTFKRYVEIAANTQTYQDNAVGGGVTYTYRVRACNSSGCSDYSNEESVTTPTPPVVPAKPVIDSVTPVSATSLEISWGNVANETEYRIERSTAADSGFSQIAVRPADSTYYVDTGLTADTTYYYRILASNSNGNSPYSDVVSGTTMPAELVAITDLSISLDAINTTFAWTDYNTTEEGFEGQYISAVRGTCLVTWVGATSITFPANLDETVSYIVPLRVLPTGQYCARVRAFRGSPRIYSVWSNVVMVDLP